MSKLIILTFIAAGLNAQNSAQGYVYYSVDGYGDLAMGNARSVGARRRFRPGDCRRFVPFGGGGYGLAFRGNTLNTVCYGFGATYWFHDRAGARFEVRDCHARDGRFMSSFRIALSFR